MQEVEIALAEEAFQKDKAQLAGLWAQRTHQFQQAVDLQVLSAKQLSLPAIGQQRGICLQLLFHCKSPVQHIRLPEMSAFGLRTLSFC